MASRRSLTFGGGLSFRKRDKGGQDSPGSTSEKSGSTSSKSVALDAESDESPRGSVNFHSSPDHQPEPAPLPTVTPNTGLNAKKRRTDLPGITPANSSVKYQSVGLCLAIPGSLETITGLWSLVRREESARHAKTVPVANKTANRRQLAEILANQQQILKRMAKLESMMEDLQKTKQRTQGAGNRQRKPEVSNDVRNMVRQGYDHAINTDGKEKWNLTKGMKATSAVNSETTQAVHHYVQGLLPDYADKIPVVKAAVDTYFASKAREERRVTEGKADKHKKNCKRNTRKAQKMNRRRKALRAKQSYNAKLKEQLQRVLVAEYMSSDESDTDDNGERVLKTKAIPWESDEFAKYKHELDMKFSKLQTDQAKRQSMKRIPGPPSTTNFITGRTTNVSDGPRMLFGKKVNP
ncbi:hypothetical protein Bbelb_373050 [Branchiostoma belcheri]|nr:hypothetical protein Bbelb_373050 [Branchiostoma belcheri]